MLVLSRKKDETIIIGDNSVTVKIIEINGGQVKLGIEAPREVSIYREELYESIKDENMQSLTETKPDSGKLPAFIKRIKQASDNE
jgi:carbon storage regulator